MLTLPAVCLSLTIYFEARSEPVAGQVAVAQIVLNRARNTGTDICSVVHAGGEQPVCQFSWWCDGKSDTPHEEVAWWRAQLIASAVLGGSGHAQLRCATHYHADYVSPKWEGLTLVMQIGKHLFYEPQQTENQTTAECEL